MDTQLPWNIFTLNIILYRYQKFTLLLYSYIFLLLLMLLARLCNQPAAAHVYVETNGKIGALVCVYTETNGAYGGIGETLLHSRLWLLLINMDCDRIGEQHSFLGYCIVSFYKEKFILVINSYNKNFREKIFHGLALSTKYFFNSELFPNYGITVFYCTWLALFHQPMNSVKLNGFANATPYLYSLLLGDFKRLIWLKKLSAN